jgi:hypothetical protein
MNTSEELKVKINKNINSKIRITGNNFNGVIIYLILISILLVPIDLSTNLPDWLIILEKIIVTIFTLEYFIRAWTISNPFKFIFSFWGIVDLIALLPFYVNQLGIAIPISMMLAFRFLRILRIFKICNTAECKDYKKSYISSFINLFDDERIENIIDHHPIVFFSKLISPIILNSFGLAILFFSTGSIFSTIASSVFFLFSFVIYWFVWGNHNYDILIVTNKRLIFHDKELFGSKIKDFNYESITNIEPDDIGIWNSILGKGNLLIEIMGIEDPFIMKSIKNPHDVTKNIISNRNKFTKHLTGDPTGINHAGKSCNKD